METHRFEVTHHFDVWGNAEDGWQVNDCRDAGTVEVQVPPDDAPHDAYERAVWVALCEAGIAHGKFEDAEFRSLGCGYDIDQASDGMPVFSLYTEDW